MTGHTGRPPRLWHWLRDQKQFGRLWSALAVSNAGSGVSYTAIPVFLYAEFGAAALGLSVSALTLATLCTVPLAGHLADRWSCTRLAQLGMAVSAVALSVLTWAPAGAGVGLVVGAAVLSGIGVGLQQAGLRALVPRLTPASEAPRAFGLIRLTEALAATLGPAASGLMLLAVSPRSVLQLDAATFMAAALMLAAVRDRPDGQAPERADPVPPSTAVRAALRARPWLLAGMTQVTAQVLVGFGPAFVLVRVVAIDRYGEAALGVLLTGAAVASLAGTALAVRWRPRLPGLVANIGLASYAGVGACLALPVALPMFLTVFVAASLLISLHGIWWYAGLVRAVPAAVRGRVLALDLLSAKAAEPVAAAVTVPVTQAVGLTAVGLAGSAAFLLAPALALLVPGLAGYGGVFTGSGPVDAEPDDREMAAAASPVGAPADRDHVKGERIA